jgi:hypothetical protein
MDYKTYFVFLRWMLAVTLFCGAASLTWSQTKSAAPAKSPAQTQAQAQAQAQANAQNVPDKVWVKDPSNIMAMRQMTNTQRRAAAERGKVRHAQAEAQKRQHAKTSTTGVQQ